MFSYREVGQPGAKPRQGKGPQFWRRFRARLGQCDDPHLQFLAPQEGVRHVLSLIFSFHLEGLPLRLNRSNQRLYSKLVGEP